MHKEDYQNDIKAIESRIAEFNAHWLSHKHIMSAFAAVVMALIFLGMLIKSIELYLWGLAGILTVVFVVVMVGRTRQAGVLNAELEAAQKGLKEYERGRRKKK